MLKLPSSDGMFDSPPQGEPTALGRTAKVAAPPRAPGPGGEGPV
jgi:hypothetical protein